MNAWKYPHGFCNFSGRPEDTLFLVTYDEKLIMKELKNEDYVRHYQPH